MKCIGQLDLEKVRLCVEYGADVNEKHYVHYALHYAVRGGCLLRGRQYHTLISSAQKSQLEIVRILLEAGALVDQRTCPNERKADTPLMLAVTENVFTSLEVVKILLKYDADVCAVNNSGLTASAHGRIFIDRTYPSQGMRTSTVWNDPYTRPDVSPPAAHYWRLSGLVEDKLELLADVRAAGSWKRFANAPRRELLVLRKLVERGRARPPRGALARLFPSGRRHRTDLPDVVFWEILGYWRSSRDACE